jgi:hypothetical protein
MPSQLVLAGDAPSSEHAPNATTRTARAKHVVKRVAVRDTGCLLAVGGRAVEAVTPFPEAGLLEEAGARGDDALHGS